MAAPDDKQDATSFERLADERPPGLVREFAQFLVHSKKWWLLPIIIAVLVLGVLVALSGTVVAPLIYPFF